MKNLFSIKNYLLPSTEGGASSVDVVDVPYRDTSAVPVFFDAPCVVYNNNNVSSIIAAAILHSERGWRCFKAGDALPLAQQYLWLDVHPNRKLFSNPAEARKSTHYLFVQGLHPMVAKVTMWGTFQNAYAGWTYKGTEKPDSLGFLLQAALGIDEAERYSVIMDLAAKFYQKAMTSGNNKKQIFAEICPLACVFRNVQRAIYSLKYSVPFEPTGIDHADVTAYLEAVEAAKDSLRNLRRESVYEGNDHVSWCGSTAIDNFWLAKRVVLFSYKYYMNVTITLTGVIVDTNVRKPPENYADEIIVR